MYPQKIGGVLNPFPFSDDQSEGEEYKEEPDG